jgi:hypothetical protein
MRSLVKLIVIAFALFLLSCHSDIPDLPEFPKEESCRYGTPLLCKSISNGEITQKECEFFGGEPFDGVCGE